MREDMFFYCYSPRLYHFLKAHGIKYVCTGLHERTKRKFWQFLKTDEVRRLLDEYEAQKTTRE